MLLYGLQPGTVTTGGGLVTLGLGLTPSRVLLAGMAPSAGGGPTYTLTADHGTIAFTGSDAQRDLSMVADYGAVSLAGQDAAFSVVSLPDYTLTAEHGTVSLTGQNAGSLRTYRLLAEHGSISITGQSAQSQSTSSDAQSGGSWGNIAWPRKRKPTKRELTEEAIPLEALPAADVAALPEPVAKKARKAGSIKLGTLLGKAQVAEMSAVDLAFALQRIKRKKRQQEDEMLLLM